MIDDVIASLRLLTADKPAFRRPPKVKWSYSLSDIYQTIEVVLQEDPEDVLCYVNAFVDRGEVITNSLLSTDNKTAVACKQRNGCLHTALVMPR